MIFLLIKNNLRCKKSDIQCEKIIRTNSDRFWLFKIHRPSSEKWDNDLHNQEVRAVSNSNCSSGSVPLTGCFSDDGLLHIFLTKVSEF